jgi:hypothetical protein
MGFIVQASTDFTLRGCVVSDCYALVNHSGGLYSYDVKGLVVESCFFIRNGWCPGVAGAEATVFNRNLYISHSPGAVVRDTLDADGASGGMQLRLGGRCERNLFVRTPMSIGYGHGENPEGSTTTGVISQNVILGGRDITKLPMATGITVGTSSVGVEVSENIITHNTEGTGNVAGIALIGEDTETAGGIDIHHNIIHDWQYQGSGYGFVFFQSGTRNLRLRNVTIHDNVVQQSGDASLIGTEATAGLSGATFSANTYHTPRSAGAWFKLAGEFYDWDAWKGLTGDTSTDRTAKSFPDANRDVVSYMQSIGKTATIDEFLRLAREQSKDAWMPQITARAVIDYVREGFGLAPIATSE